MKDETKEILNKLLLYFKESNINDFGYEKDKLISYEEAQILLNYINNLQEEYQNELDENYKLSEWLVQKRIEIEKLTAESTEWESKCYDLQEENKNLKLSLKDRLKYSDELDEKIERIDKAKDKIQYIIDYGFDYDGFNTVESLKGLIDMLVDYARQSKDILNGDDE